ncbi:glutaminyl-peptide cyclotransferase [Pseudonocardia sp. GCM10023141]|uniref:glutaminyl-peptide cyclotransferase n=1 Tax=Pseudonocardia sp. GCM10023141 TaxID=3252653 RepID=UPI0036147CB3
MGLGRALVGAMLLLMAGCAAAAPAPSTLPVWHPQVLAQLPHDRGAFTEGLEVVPGSAGAQLYESTGLAGQSQLREVDTATGTVTRSVPLPGDVFGEGLTVVGPRIWQLTWRDGVALEWDRASFTLLRQVPITGEGWGLCLDGNRLVRSDGTDTLHFHDPATFAETGTVAVTLDGAPVPELNELECVAGQVWANVWKTERLVRIDPATGHVTAVVDATGLLDPAQRAGTDVMNGIAALGGDEYLLTGKYWPVTFRVRLGG